MNKRISGAALAVLLCGSGCMKNKSPIFTAHLGPRTDVTPEQRALATAINAQRGHLENAAVAALDIGEYVQAETNARQSLAWGAGSGKGQELLASALNAQGKTQEALQAYKTIADQGGVFPRNMVPYAMLLLKTGQWAQAVNAYNKALPYMPYTNNLQLDDQFSPNVPQPKELAVALHIAQGLTYIGDAGWETRSKREEAMSEFDQALRLAPNSALTNYYYGFGWKHLDLKSPIRIANARRAKDALHRAASLDGGGVRKAAETALADMR